jgi:hypothetical protein
MLFIKNTMRNVKDNLIAFHFQTPQNKLLQAVSQATKHGCSRQLFSEDYRPCFATF